MYSLEEFKKLSSKKKENQVYGPSKDDVLYQKYLESKPQKAWRDEAIERLTPKALTPPTQAGPTYLEKLAENRERAKQLSARVPETATAAGNIREMIFGKPIEAGTVNPRISAADFSTRYDSMTDREKAVYSHLKNTNAKDADEYLKAIDMDINQRNAEKRVADARKIAEESTAAGLYERFMGNNIVSNGAATAYELWQGLRNQPVDPNHPLLAGQDIVKGQNEAFVGDSTGIERYLREGAMGAFDLGTNIALGVAMGLKGVPLQNMVKGSFAAQAFAGSARDAAEREGAGMQSVLTGTASAALATIIEGIGLDRLAEIGKLANARGVLKSMARSILPEAAEEAVEEAGNILADAVIMGDKNEIVNLYNTARANGATQNDAMMGALGVAGKRIGESAIIGGISGGMIGGGVAMTNRVLGGNVLENDVPDTNVGNTEPVADPTVTPQNPSQNPVTVHETAISEGLSNSPAEMRTQPTEAQTKQAKDRDNYLERYYHENGANILRTEAEKRGSLKDAEDILRPYYTAGVMGMSFDEVEQTAFTSLADPVAARDMYQAGVNDRTADMTARLQGRVKLSRQTSGVLLKTEAVTEKQKALANLVAKLGKVEVEIVDTLPSRANGEYQNGRIYVALDAESFSGALFHETVHYIAQANAKGYDRMAQTVMRMAAEVKGMSVDAYVRAYEDMYADAVEKNGYDAIAVREELIADAFQMLAADEARCRSLIAELEQSNPTVLEQIKEFLQKMLETLEGLMKDGRFHAFAEDINKDIENTKKLQKIFAEELREAGRTAETKKQPAEQTGDTKFSVRLGMTEEERYEELKNREIVVYSDTETKNYPKEFATIEELQKTAKNSARKEIKKLAAKLGVLHKGMKMPEVEVEFILSGEGLRESFNKQTQYGGSYLDFAKAIANLDKIMKTAVLLEEHEDKYKGTDRENENLEKVSVLFGAFEEEGDVIPVQMEIKKASDIGGRLYMTVAMTKIEAGVIEARPVKTEPDSLLPTSTYRLADIFREINVADKNFLKYVPEKFLNKAQRAAKEEALQAEAKKIANLRGESDSEGRELSAGQREYFKDSKAVDENGKLLVMYHGTRKGEFESFHDWTYLTANKEYAERYTDKDTGKTMYEVYANIKKPFDTRLPEVRAIFEDEFMGVYGGTPLQESGLPDWTDGYDLAEFIEENGYDFDAILLDEGADPDGKGGVIERGISYVIRNSEQAKDVKNLTPTSDKRLKFSVRESGEAELRRENASLISENKHLQKLNDNLKKQFKLTDGTTPDPKSVRRVAKDWLEQIQSKADVDDFSMKLGKITEYFAKAENKNDREHAMAALRVLVRDAMEQAETLNTEMRDEYSGLIKQIKNTSLKVTDELRRELENYGGYNTIRRANFGRMNLSADGKTSIDEFYYELCQEYPEFFREDDAADEAEQLMNIIAELDTLKPVAENPYGYSLDEYVYDETMGLLDKMAGISMEQTFADKRRAERVAAEEENKKTFLAGRMVEGRYKAKEIAELETERQKLKKEKTEKVAALKKAKAEFQTSVKAMRDEVKAAQEEAEKAFLAGRMVEGRNKAKEIAKLEAKHLRLKERNKKAADNRKARADRRIIEKEAKAMLEWLANPTDTKHIPEALKKHTAYLLTMFTTGKDDRLTNLQLVVSKLAEEYRKLDPDDKRNEDMTGRYIEYDDNLTLIAEALEESLKKRTDGLISLNNLTAEEMSDLKDMIRMLKKTLMEANKLVTMDKRAEVANVSEDIIADMRPRKNAVQTGKLRVLNDFFKLDMLDANSFFRRMSNTAYATIYRSFRKGLDTKIRCVKEAADFMNELVDKKTVKQWRDTAPEKIELMGGTVYLNIPQIMSVYCLSRREQGKQHLYTGGVVGDTDYQKKRLSKETLEAMRQVTGSRLTEADVKQITDRLTAEQKHVAREMQKFLSENAAKWGNDVTMQLFGYKKFNEQNYFPIKVDGDSTMVTVGKPKDATRSLRSLGMTKQLKKNARNPVMARDIFTVFAEHIDQMSSYAAFVPAISDTNKILNYKTEGGASVKKELRRVMGDGGIGYIHKLVDMINGAVAYSNDGAFAKSMVRNMKIASVGFNARVVAQQPTSIVRASMVIKPQYIVASAIPTKKDWENIYRYAPISWWKEQGYYDVNIGKSIEGLMTGSTGMEKVTDASMWAAGKADKFTWGWMWKAAEKQIREEQPGLTGDAFYEAVGELFSRAIDETQVVDSPLHRSQKMREKGLFTQMTTSFMSEPTKTYNMATTAMMNLMRENTPENRKQFARTLWWLTASAAATAAAAAVVDAGRDDDDDEKWADKWLAAFRGDYSEAETKGDMAKAFFGSNFGSSVNPMNYIPYMKDLMSIFDGYDIRRTDMDWAVDIKNAMNRLHKYAEGDSEYTAYATFTYVAGAFSKVFGVPMKSIMRDMEAMVNWANIHLIGTEGAKYENSRRNLAVGSKKNMSYYTERYLKAYQNGDKALAQKIYNDMISGGVDEEELKQKIASNVNDMMFDAHVMGNDSEFRKFWNEQNGRGKEDSSLRTSMRSRYETMYKNAVKNGDSEAQREAKAGFMEFGGKETTLDKYH